MLTPPNRSGALVDLLDLAFRHPIGEVMATQPRHRWQHQNETDVSDDEWIEPLRQFQRTIADNIDSAPRAAQFNIEHFYVGPRLLRPGLANLHLYKHMETGRTLGVDTRGAPYRYIPPGPDGIGGHWSKYGSTARALADLDPRDVLTRT